VKVSGRGRIVTDPARLDKCREIIRGMGTEFNELVDTEQVVTSFIDGSRFLPRRLFTVLAHDEDVPRIIEAITNANRSEHGIGDGIIFVMPALDAVRIRTGESGEAAIW